MTKANTIMKADIPEIFYLKEINQAKYKNTFVFGNAGGEKNLHPGGRKFFYLIFHLIFIYSI